MMKLIPTAISKEKLCHCGLDPQSIPGLRKARSFFGAGALLPILGLACITGAGPAAAQDSYPSRPITIIVPFSAGGTTDILARIVGNQLNAELGQPVVINNKAGAGGNIGAAMAAKSPADGYTLFLGTVGTHAINAALYKSLPFDHVKDFAPLTRVAMVPNLLVANPSQPFKTVKELIAYATKNPGKVNFASAGTGGSTHLSGELFKSLAKVDMQHIPYKGSAPAIADVLSGQVQITFDNLPSAIQHVRAGKLRALGITSAQRVQTLPDVPTIAEAGVPGYETISWFGLFAPAGTPAPVLSKLHVAMSKIMNNPDVRKRIQDQGGEPMSDTPEEFRAFIELETRKWSKVVRESGATAE